MAFIQLPSGKVKNLKPKKLKLTNFPRNHNISVLFLYLKYLDNAYDLDFQINLVKNIEKSENLQKYLLASSEIGHHLYEEI